MPDELTVFCELAAELNTLAVGVKLGEVTAMVPAPLRVFTAAAALLMEAVTAVSSGDGVTETVEVAALTELANTLD